MPVFMVTLKPSLNSLRKMAVISPTLLVVALFVSVGWLTRGHPEVLVAESVIGALAGAVLAAATTWSRVEVGDGMITYRGIVGRRRIAVGEIGQIQWLKPMSVPTLTFCIIQDRQGRGRIALAVPYWGEERIHNVIDDIASRVQRDGVRVVSAPRIRSEVAKGLPIFLSHPVAASMVWAVTMLAVVIAVIALAAPPAG